METNAYRSTLDKPSQGPAFAPAVKKNAELGSMQPAFVTCCDCCCGGAGKGCTLHNGIRSFSIWYAIVSFCMFIWFLALAMNKWIASFGFFVLIYSIIHGMCALEGFRLINFQNAQEYHVRGKRLYAIYVIVTTINSCISIAIAIISIQIMTYGWVGYGFFYFVLYGGPFTAHAIACYRSIVVLKRFFELQRYNALQKLQQV